MLQTVNAVEPFAAPIPLATRDLNETTFGPQTDFSNYLHATKYRSEGETFRDAMNRVASTLRDTDSHFESFRDSILKMRFLPAGRIQAAVGTTRAVTPYNCFVSGTIEDSFVDGHGCIMDRAREAAATMRMGGGIGYDFSPLRPRGEFRADVVFPKVPSVVNTNLPFADDREALAPSKPRLPDRLPFSILQFDAGSLMHRVDLLQRFPHLSVQHTSGTARANNPQQTDANYRDNRSCCCKRATQTARSET